MLLDEFKVRMSNKCSYNEFFKIIGTKMGTDSSPAAQAPQPGDSYVRSFARGLEVIRSFSQQAPAQTLSEVAQRTGLTRAGARRILLTLQALGYVDSDGRQFRLTPRILDLGFAYLSSMPFWSLAEPEMESLADEIGESCSAAVLEGTDVVYVLRVHTHKIMRTSLGVGSRLPAYCTALGRVLLAGLNEADLRQRLLASGVQRNTEHTVTDIDELVDRIGQVRQQGWSLVNQELEEGLISVAAPILNRSGKVIAAINISGQVNRTDVQAMQQRYLPALLQRARSISARIG
jgi:IclR family pca regulon transcriptional regulator